MHGELREVTVHPRRVRAWVGVVSRSHVQRGVAGSFAQLGHGKRGPLARMSVGDWLVYYSPSTEYPNGKPLCAFTAIGRVVGDAVCRVDMGGGFMPFRRDVAYAAGTREVPIDALRSRLDFIDRRPHWGMLARRGHFEITMADLRIVANAMGAHLVKPGRRSDRRGRPTATLGWAATRARVHSAHDSRRSRHHLQQGRRG